MTRHTAEAWKQRAMWAEEQRDRVEQELFEVRNELKQLTDRIERFMFAAARNLEGS